MTVIDVGGQVRHGEELDISAVETWLKDQGVILQGQAGNPIFRWCIG